MNAKKILFILTCLMSFAGNVWAMDNADPYDEESLLNTSVDSVDSHKSWHDRVDQKRIGKRNSKWKTKSVENESKIDSSSEQEQNLVLPSNWIEFTPPSTPRRSSIDSGARSTSELNTSTDSWSSDFSSPDSSPPKVGFNDYSSGILLFMKNLEKSPYKVMVENVNKASITPCPLPFSLHEESEVREILSTFIVDDIATKEKNFWRFHRQLWEHMPQLSSASRQKLLIEFTQKLNEHIAQDPGRSEDSSISRLIGLVWGYNALLPEAKRLPFKTLPQPVLNDRAHLIEPTVLKGGKPTGYHLANPNITQCPLTLIFPCSKQGVYAGTWGKTLSKCSTFFPDTWNIKDIEVTINKILCNPRFLAITTKELSLPAQATASQLASFDSLEDELQCVETIRLLGYGKDQVLTEVIFNAELGFIITAYPILDFKVLPEKQATGWKCTIGAHSYTYAQIDKAIKKARKDPLAIRYTKDGFEVIDIAQTSVIKKNNVLATDDFRGIYIQVSIKEPLDEFTTFTESYSIDFNKNSDVGHDANVL